MKKVFLIHGYNGVPQIYNWLEKELRKMEYEVFVPEFPAQEGVIYEEWERKIEKYKEQFDKDSIVIAHSIGNAFILKYITKYQIPISLYISLAGFAEIFEKENRDDLNRAIKEFVISEEEVEDFQKLCQKRYSIYSDNDHIVPMDVLENYPKRISAIPIFIQGIGHMGKKSGLEKIPKVVEIIEGERIGLEYVKNFPESPSFIQKEFFSGYVLSNELGPEMDYIDMKIGHEYYQIESESIHLYYIIEGKGTANIAGKMYPLKKGDTVKVPVQTEYAFQGNMKMIEIMYPQFNSSTHIDTKLNDITIK